MPVLSPHRSSSSGLNGSYRSSFGSSALDRPYYNTTSAYSPRITSYSERFTTRSYLDGDGRRVFSRSGSITEDGVTTRFREESRENSVRRDSFSRDSGISSIRENSILETTPSRRERDLSLNRSELARDRESRLSAPSVAESLAELRNKYSPANYVPAILRKNENMSRSKSINDIGLPPADVKSSVNSKKVNDSYCNNIGVMSLSNSTNKERNDNAYPEDDNGNRPSVQEILKKFDGGEDKKAKSPPLEIEGVRIADNRFKKEDTKVTVEKSGSLSKHKKNEKVLNGDAERPAKKTSLLLNGDEKKKPVKTSRTDVLSATVKKQNGEIDKCEGGDKKCASEVRNLDKKAKLKVSKKEESISNGIDIGRSSESLQNGVESDSGSETTATSNSETSRSSNRTNNFASYIPAKDFDKGDSKSDEVSTDILKDDMDKSNLNKRNNYKTDISASPRLNRGISQNATGSTGASTSNNVTNRNSLERDRRDRDDDRFYDRTSPVRNLGLNGLKNIGNTCFMNSVIQCLSNTRLLLEYVKRDAYVDDINTSISSMKGALIRAFSQVIKELWSEDASDRVVNTLALKSQIQRFAPRFIGYAQQDAQEFLRYLLEGLHEDVNRVVSKPTPILTEIDEKLSDDEKSAESWRRYLRMDNSKVVDIFVGQLKSTLRCTHCGHCSVTFDPFWDLSLPIPQKAGPVKLSQCLEYFTREETLDGDEKPTCSKCKERRKCTKSFTIQKFPKILVIHLKRFSPTERYRGKLSVTVDFPLEGLDMRNYAADGVADSRYNLYAISNHSGTTYSGHYTAYCRHPYTHLWHEYNDSRVSAISSKNIVSGEAYVLFYELDSQKAHL